MDDGAYAGVGGLGSTHPEAEGAAVGDYGPLSEILSGSLPCFALLYRPGHDTHAVDVLVGAREVASTLTDLPFHDGTEQVRGALPTYDTLAVVPYRQIRERGFQCEDDGTPLLALRVSRQDRVPLAAVLAGIEDAPVKLCGGQFDIDDDDYAGIVRRVVCDEIGEGHGSNFVIKRAFVADLVDYGPRTALAIYRRLLERERGTYWTFLVHLGDRTLVGATPECHVGLHDGTVTMNPVSGTYRHPASGPELSGLLGFLADRKEADELYMVVDEELKMMARMCTRGVRLVGPSLKEMSRLAHTEYFLEGRSDLDPRVILRETLLAPTVTGSPLENACRVIKRHERRGRGYYSGVLALMGRDAGGRDTLDSAIIIRTADIDRTGRTEISVGSTVVRGSQPESEAAETAAKARALISALQHDLLAGGRDDKAAGLGRHHRVQAALKTRNRFLAHFWLGESEGGRGREPAFSRAGRTLSGKSVLVIDAEDAFTDMLTYQLRSLGMAVTVRRFDEPCGLDGFDLVIPGPGPGDPRHPGDFRLQRLDTVLRTLLSGSQPFLAVCLSHQLLCRRLGLELIRKQPPNQGVQAEIDLFGTPERVGFYNTFAARSADDVLDVAGVGRVDVSRDPRSAEVHALRGPFFAATQFHSESVLTHNGPRILGDLLRGFL
ncbi:anthranilate synthase family protein [Streptomyces sp. Lzd4kr]|nr:anthranilate synthase family protein [Streptomyces sp. Lzd4kr]